MRASWRGRLGALGSFRTSRGAATPLSPRQPNDRGIKYRERKHSGGERFAHSKELVGNEEHQQDDHRRIGPEPATKDRSDENDLAQAMGQQIGGGEATGTAEVGRRLPPMNGEEITGIF